MPLARQTGDSEASRSRGNRLDNFVEGWRFVMGARWAWWAKCPNGHIYSNFSGGADNCYECDLPPAVELDCQHWWKGYENCDCKEQIKKLEVPCR